MSTSILDCFLGGNMNNKRVLVIVLALLFQQMPAAFPESKTRRSRSVVARRSHSVVASMICGDLSSKAGGRWRSRYYSSLIGENMKLQQQIDREKRRRRELRIRAQAERDTLDRYLQRD